MILENVEVMGTLSFAHSEEKQVIKYDGEFPEIKFDDEVMKDMSNKNEEELPSNFF